MTGHEYTIEGRPNTKEDWNGVFYNQRRDRLSDVIGDYITDESSDARQCYEEILSEIDGWIKYHQSYLNKTTELKSLMLGHRPVDFINDPITSYNTDRIFIQE